MTSSLLYSALSDPLICALLFLFALSWVLSTFLLLSVLLFAAGVCYRFQDVGVFLWLCSGVAFAFAVCPDLIILIFLLLSVLGITIVFHNYDVFYRFVVITFRCNRFWSKVHIFTSVSTRFINHSVYEYCRSLFRSSLSVIVEWRQSKKITRAPSSEVEFGFSRLNSLKNDSVSTQGLLSGDEVNSSPSSWISFWYHSFYKCSFCRDCADFDLPSPSLSINDDSCFADRNSLIDVGKASSSTLTSTVDDYSFIDSHPKDDRNAHVPPDTSDLNYLSSRLERLVISGLSGENALCYGAAQDLTTWLVGRGDPTSFSACRCTRTGRTKNGMCSCMGHICPGTSCSCHSHTISRGFNGVSIGSLFRHCGYDSILDKASAFYGNYCRISPWFLQALDNLQERLALLCLDSGSELSPVRESHDSNSAASQNVKVQEWKADPGVLSNAATSDLLSDMMSRNLLLDDDNTSISGQRCRDNDLLNDQIPNQSGYQEEDPRIEWNSEQVDYPFQYTVGIDDVRRSLACNIASDQHSVAVGEDYSDGNSNNSVMASTVSRETIVYGSDDYKYSRDTHLVSSGFDIRASFGLYSDQQEADTTIFEV